MFHGNGTFLQDFTFSGLVDAAAHKFRVICFDRPGFGHSSRPRTFIWSPDRQAELFAAALTRLGIERTLVLGHSWGTLVALAMAASRNGKRVKGLVLVSGYYFPTWRFDVWFASIAAIPLIGDVLRYTAIIAGRDDKIVASEQAVRLQKAMPHATVTLVPEAGHMVHYFVVEGIVKTATLCA
jgi:pimeloyl-ACP methyl ester carboxylesterase